MEYALLVDSMGRSPRVRGRLTGSAYGLFFSVVDPRGCGGDFCLPFVFNRLTGRSPRVRGRRPVSGASTSLRGSIPAGAGETVPFIICIR